MKHNSQLLFNVIAIMLVGTLSIGLFYSSKGAAKTIETNRQLQEIIDSYQSLVISKDSVINEQYKVIDRYETAMKENIRVMEMYIRNRYLICTFKQKQ